MQMQCSMAQAYAIRYIRSSNTFEPIFGNTLSNNASFRWKTLYATHARDVYVDDHHKHQQESLLKKN